MFLKAQLVLFLAKASPYGSCGIQNETRILENTQFALIDFSETLSTIPCAAGSARAPPSSLNDPRGGAARGLGAQPLSQILGFAPFFAPLMSR